MWLAHASAFRANAQLLVTTLAAVGRMFGPIGTAMVAQLVTVGLFPAADAQARRWHAHAARSTVVNDLKRAGFADARRMGGGNGSTNGTCI